jgi:hypothetical protein
MIGTSRTLKLVFTRAGRPVRSGNGLSARKYNGLSRSRTGRAVDMRNGGDAFAPRGLNCANERVEVSETGELRCRISRPRISLRSVRALDFHGPAARLLTIHN